MLKIAVRIHNKEIEATTFYSWDECHKYFFSPFYDDKYVIPFRVSGKTYQAKKEDLRQQAIDYSNIQSVLNLYGSEVAEISAFFEKNGKRYGLLKEFRENGIC